MLLTKAESIKVMTRALDRRGRGIVRSWKDALNVFYTEMVNADKKRPKEIGISGKKVEFYPGVVLYIASDPVLIALKTSGRKWDACSSSKIFDWLENADIIDDIRFGNYVAYVMKKGGDPFSEDDVFGRVMLRRCGKGGKNVGIETNWYFSTDDRHGCDKAPLNSTKAMLPGFQVKAATAALLSFLEDHGFLDYVTCKTDYKYGGYSDVAGGYDTEIQYDSREYPAWKKRRPGPACPD